MNRITIRPALPSDARDIATVHVKSWRETYAGMFPQDYLASLSVNERYEMWTRVLDSPVSPTGTFVAVDGEGSVVGFGSCGKQRSDEIPAAGEFYAIYVLKRVQQLGLGQLLMLEMSAHLTKQEIYSASVWVVRENMKARRFYEALGGSVITEKEDKSDGFPIWETAYLWKTLPSQTP